MKCKGKIYNDSLEMANNFNDNFINSINEISQPRDQIKDTKRKYELNLNPTKELEINKIVTELSNSKSKDIHGLDSDQKAL